MNEPRVHPPIPQPPLHEGCEGCPLKGFKRVGTRGDITSPFVIVGEAPGSNELKEGLPFVGASGKIVEKYIDLDGVFITNALLCRPPPKHKNKQKLLEAAIPHCRERLFKELYSHPRKVVLALGNAAAQSCTGDSSIRITKNRGELRHTDFTEVGTVLALHPAALLRGSGSYRQWKLDVNYALDLQAGGRPHGDTVTEIFEFGYDFGRREEDDWFVTNIIIPHLKQQKHLTCDLETTGFSPFNDAIIAVGISSTQEFGFDFNVRYLPQLCHLFESTEIVWNYHNGKFDIKFLRNNGVRARVDSDTLLLSYCLDENPGVHDLETVSGDYLGAPNYKDMLDAHLPKKGASYIHVPQPILTEYLGYDLANTYELRKVLQAKVEGDAALKKLYTKTLIPASEMLACVEMNGFAVDLGRVAENEISFGRDVEELESQLHAEAGWSFNPNSWQQVQKVLYDQMGLRIRGRRPDSTDAQTLEKLEQIEIVRLLQKYRKVRKAYGTYVKNVPGLIDLDGRIHSTYLLHGTPTGRLASRNPNLQNIPRDKRLRGTYVAKKGYVLLEIDLSQAELRSLAQLSGDAALCEIYNSDTLDLHTEVQLALFGPSSIGNKELRVRAKTVNFGIVYGVTAHTLSDKFGVSLVEAQRWIDGWFMRFPDAYKFIMSCRAIPARGGTITTVFGRRKRHGVISRERLRDLQNEAANMPHQSIANDINLHGAMSAFEVVHNKLNAKYVNFVHDSILVEVPNNEQVILDVAHEVKEAVESTAPRWGLTRVPFRADIEVGDRWGYLEELKL